METTKNWVDYKTIKSTVTMEMALSHYNVLAKLKQPPGKNAIGCCPIHNGKNPRQFSVCLTKNIWRCFGSCDTGGNVLDFVSKMEGGISIRDSAILLKKLFLDNDKNEPATPVLVKRDQEKPATTCQETTKQDQDDPMEPEINPPLKFRLKSLDQEHPFFAKHGIEPETVDYFGLGFCTKGMLKGRIAIPIHNQQGELIAYCGRSISAEQAEKDGQYKMPPKFVRSEAVFNLHRQDKTTDTLILVEDFISSIMAHQHGFSNFVAIMGSNLGKGQEKAIFRHLGPSGRLLLLFSSSEYSQKCAETCLQQFSSRLYCKKVDISHIGKTPASLTTAEINSLI